MLYTKEAPYVYARDSVFYFNRRVPKDLQRHFRHLSRKELYFDPKKSRPLTDKLSSILTLK